jgi:hypothetical protein
VLPFSAGTSDCFRLKRFPGGGFPLRPSDCLEENRLLRSDAGEWPFVGTSRLHPRERVPSPPIRRVRYSGSSSHTRSSPMPNDAAIRTRARQ